MTSVLHNFLLFFILTSATAPRAKALLRRYLSPISGIHEYYRSSSIWFATAQKNQLFDEYTSSHDLVREFSQKGVQTLTITYDEVSKFTRTSGRQGVRPFIVVLLKTIQELHDFARNIRNVNISYSVWLLIFTEEFDNGVCEYCNRPFGNVFGLRFDTEMFVICCKDSIVSEWWTVHKNQTNRAIFGTWTKEDGFKLVAKKSLYSRRNDLEGIKLRVAFLTISAFYYETDGKMDGYLHAIIMELKRFMNFKMTTILLPNHSESKDSMTQNWFDFLKYIGQGGADIGVGEFMIFGQRRQFVDFTLPFTESPTQLHIKRPNGSEVQWSAYVKAFTYPIWLTIILAMTATTVLLALIEMRKGKNSFANLFITDYLHVWGIFCAQGLPVFPTETPLRIIYYSLFVTAFVISVAYSGTLTSFATVSTPTLPFSTVEEFVDDGSYGVIVLKKTAHWDLLNTAQDPVMSKMKTLVRPAHLLPRNKREIWKQVCTERVALLMNFQEFYGQNESFLCSLNQLDTGVVDKLAMIMPIESQYTGLVNYQLQRFQETGITKRLKVLYPIAQSEPETTSSEVSLWGVAVAFSILAGGIIVALVIFLCEKSYERLCWELKRRRTKKRNSISF